MQKILTTQEIKKIKDIEKEIDKLLIALDVICKYEHEDSRVKVVLRNQVEELEAELDELNGLA